MLHRYAPRPWLLLATIVASAGGVACEPKGQWDATEQQVKEVTAVTTEKELMVTDLSVVEDATRTGVGGAWTFGRLFTWMAGANDPSDFALHWLQQWEQDQTINGDTDAARPAIRTVVTDPWLAASGGSRLDLTKAPFRLLAIVNRMDLRNLTDVGRRDAGEGRFVFGVLDATGAPLPFTVILEYELPAKDNNKVRKWAQDWHDLGNQSWGNSYNSALQKLTDDWSRNNCDKVNQSCIKQVRTNEVSLSPSNSSKLWELREFHLNASGFLDQTVVAQTPRSSINGTATLASFINSNEAAILAGQHQVSADLLGADSPAPLGGVWTAPGINNNEARFHFAATTCAGCHTTETGTKFLHVKNRAAGTVSALSAFLTGGTAPDPVSGVIHSFSDLARRGDDLIFVLNAKDKDLSAKPKKNSPH